MFGYININQKELSEESKKIYQAYYCGLCQKLKTNCGTKGQMLLSYDLTFLIVLLTGLYELENTETEFTCPLHPTKKRTAYINEATEYAADMNLILAYQNLLDDWKDEKSYTKKAFVKILDKDYTRIVSKYPRQVRALEEFMRKTAEAEKILSCDPDIVISEYEDVEKENALYEQLGVPVITLKAGVNGVFDDSFKESMELLGKIFERENEAEQLTQYIDDQRKQITERTAGIEDKDKPSVYICGLGNWGTTNHLMTAQNYVSFNIANVKNAVTGLAKNGIQSIEEEKFTDIGASIDIMIIDAAAVKNIKPLYKNNPDMFNTCKAWNNNEVYLEMAYNAYYTNYEIALINTWYIAKTVYPELFKDVDIKEKTDEVTEAFLGKAMSDEIFSAPLSFGGYKKIDTATFFN